MGTVSTQFELELKKVLAEEIQRLTDYVCDGNPAVISDYAVYKYYVGLIYAYRRVINTYCDEVQTIVENR